MGSHLISFALKRAAAKIFAKDMRRRIRPIWPRVMRMPPSPARARKSPTWSRALFADAFSRARARQYPTLSRTLTEAHRVDCHSNVHKGFELLNRLKPSCHEAKNFDAHLSDGHSPADDPILRPPGRGRIRSCAGCRRQNMHAATCKPPVQSSSCELTAQAAPSAASRLALHRANRATRTPARSEREAAVARVLMLPRLKPI